MTSETSPPNSQNPLFTEIDHAKLRQIIVDGFDEEELQDLCFDLEVDYEDLPAVGKSGKARELVALFQRQNRIVALIAACKEQRPNIDWEGIHLSSSERSPFKGLQAFEEADADLFYGREQLTATLLARLTQSIQQGEGAFLAVVGASGSGKSSLVKAGLIPIFKRGMATVEGNRPVDTSKWPIHTMTPSINPLE